MSLFDSHSSVVEKEHANNITTFILLPKHISVYVWSNSPQLLLMSAGMVNQNTLVNSGYGFETPQLHSNKISNTNCVFVSKHKLFFS